MYINTIARVFSLDSDATGVIRVVVRSSVDSNVEIIDLTLVPESRNLELVAS